jgi:hypothetical protein
MTGTGQGQPYRCYDAKTAAQISKKVGVSRWRQGILNTY